MSNLFANHSLRVAARQAVSGVADREQKLRVVCGQVWITIEGSAKDYWLSAGESLTVAPGRLVVVEADRLDSRVNIPGPAKRHGVFHFGAGRVRDLAQRLAHNGKAWSELLR